MLLWALVELLDNLCVRECGVVLCSDPQDIVLYSDILGLLDGHIYDSLDSDPIKEYQNKVKATMKV